MVSQDRTWLVQARQVAPIDDADAHVGDLLHEEAELLVELGSAAGDVDRFHGGRAFEKLQRETKNMSAKFSSAFFCRN